MAARRDLTPQEQLKARRLWDALDALALGLEPAVARAFQAAIDAVRAALTTAELQDIVATGDIDAILQRIDWQPIQFALRDSAITAAERTAADASAFLPGTVTVRFNVLAPQAVQALQVYESRAISVLQQDVRAGANEWLISGMQSGRNPVDTARRMRDIIGLPPKDVRAIANYERALLTGDRSALQRAMRDKRNDSVIRAAIEAGKPLPRDYVERRVANYEARALQVNAETIARTGSMDAVNVGQRLWWDEATTQGVVDRSTVRRFWIIAADERTCSRCRPIPMLNPDGVGMDELFVTPEDGMVLQPVLHFRCRCIVYYKIVEY